MTENNPSTCWVRADFDPRDARRTPNPRPLSVQRIDLTEAGRIRRAQLGGGFSRPALRSTAVLEVPADCAALATLPARGPLMLSELVPGRSTIDTRTRIVPARRELWAELRAAHESLPLDARLTGPRRALEAAEAAIREQALARLAAHSGGVAV